MLKFILKNIFGVISSSLLVIFLYFHLLFLSTNFYVSPFIDPLAINNASVIALFLIVIQSLLVFSYIKSNKYKVLLIATISILIISLSLLNTYRINKTNFILYRQDLGLQAFYLYLDDNSDKFLLEYTYPLGKSSLIGRYIRDGTIITFDKDLKTTFYLSDFYGLMPVYTLNLKNMEKIKTD